MNHSIRCKCKLYAKLYLLYKYFQSSTELSEQERLIESSRAFSSCVTGSSPANRDDNILSNRSTSRGGKGGHSESGLSRPKNSNITFPLYRGKKKKNHLQQAVLHMPKYMSDKELGLVGLRTRKPDRFELCPPDFVILEDIPDAASTKRGRPRGRPRGSRKISSTRGNEDKIAHADTTHRRYVVSKKPRAAELAGLIDTINTLTPEGVYCMLTDGNYYNIKCIFKSPCIYNNLFKFQNVIWLMNSDLGKQRLNQEKKLFCIRNLRLQQ